MFINLFTLSQKEKTNFETKKKVLKDLTKTLAKVSDKIEVIKLGWTNKFLLEFQILIFF